MTDQELDRLMERVLLDSLKSDCGTPAEELAFVPSSRHQKQIKRMLANPLGWAHRRAQPLWRRRLRRAAAILLVASAAFGSLMAVSPTARAAVTRWAVEWYETHIIYRYSGSQLTDEMPQYEITALPDGYAESERIEWENFSGVFYTNKDGAEICLSCTYMQQGSASNFASEDADMVSVEVNGLPGQLFLAKDPDKTDNTVTWIDTDANIQFSLDAPFSQEAILHMANSVSLCKLPK